MKEFALVLGGGAAKGFAHIGVIEVLEEHGIKPDYIVGTSMGAIIGGIYASGVSLKSIIKLSSAFSMHSIADVNLLHLLKNGNIMKGKRLSKLIYGMVGDTTHDELKIPFTAVATEMSTGKQHNLNTGLVWKNLLASSAMPAVFPAIDIDGKILCDGGIKNNLPISVAKKEHKNAIILAIDVIGDYKKQVEIGGLKLMTNILNMSTLYMTQAVKNSQEKADMVVKITQPEVKQMDFNKGDIQDAIQNGKTAMKRNIKKLLELLKD